jgi:hypothetical protein
MYFFLPGADSYRLRAATKQQSQLYPGPLKINWFKSSLFSVITRFGDAHPFKSFSYLVLQNNQL